MMQSKIYLLLVILSVFVVCSICVEQKLRKTDSTSDPKKKVAAQDKNDYRQKDKYEIPDNDYDDVDDNHMSLSSYAGDRYSAHGPVENNYRTRARWPAPSSPSAGAPSSYSLEDLLGGNDWSRYELPNGFPGSLSSISFDDSPMLSSGPSCHSLVDSQYPIFSDTCGAVPQARYSLPNSFGHRERWQVAQILNNLVGSSTDPACTRSLRLLLCPVLFPPCQTRHEPPAILPCQSYCRVVKARCAIPALDRLPCEALPYSSDLCPTNQAYGSFIPPGAYPSVNQPSPINSGLPSSNYLMNNGLPSSNYQMNPSSNYPMNPSSNYPMNNGLSLSNYQMNSGVQSQNYPMNSGVPSQNYQTSRSFPSLQSLVSSQGSESALTPSSLSSAQSIGPMNYYNGGQYATDSMNPLLVDFPSRSYNNDYRQASRYAPLTRSSNEARPATDARSQTETRPSAPSSVVKA